MDIKINIRRKVKYSILKFLLINRFFYQPTVIISKDTE